MNVEVNEKSKAKERDFPKLMKYNKGVLIVLAEKKIDSLMFSGTVMHDDESAYKVGYYSKEWGLPFFQDFEGSITLSNE